VINHMVVKCTVLAIVCSVLSSAQATVSRKSQVPPSPVAISAEPLHQLVMENDQVRVYRLEIQPGAETLLHEHVRDFVTIMLTDADLTETLPGKSPRVLSAANGEVAFAEGKLSHKLKNEGRNATTELVIELKHHWASEIRICEFPDQCAHKIKLGDSAIGETTSLFSNGFLTAYRHRLDPGGTLTSSYYSPKGKDRIVLVALTDVRATFGGVDESLKRGQAYYSDATEVEVSAGEKETKWAVIRIHSLN
jgi:hypothetical protein